MQKSIYYSILICAALLAFSCNNNSDKSAQKQQTTTEAQETKPVVEAEFIGVYCFLKAENKDTTIVRVNFLADHDIRGEMIWRPWQKDGATGFLKGRLNANKEMELVYDYTIEGSRQTETKIMKIEGNKLSIKQGELIDPKNDGNLVFKDVSKAVYKTVLAKINCN